MLLLAGLACWNLLLSAEIIKLRQTQSEASAAPDVPQSTRPVTVVTSDITKVVEKSESKVVAVNAYGSGEDELLLASGSGTVYNMSQNAVYILTNEHVIADAGTIFVTFASGDQTAAELVGADPYTDLALLKAVPDFKVEAFESGDSSALKKGEWVIAIGHPLTPGGEGSTTVGVLSAKDLTLPVDLDDDGQADWDLAVLQTDAAVNAGNSGGPLINMNGELIGITTMRLKDGSSEGISYAIPVNEVITIAEQLKANGKVNRPSIGISGRDVNDLTSYQKSYKGIALDRTDGLLITSVIKGSPADKAGVEADDILIRFDGTVIENNKTFRKLLYAKTVGDTAELIVLRGSKELKLSVTLE